LPEHPVDETGRFVGGELLSKLDSLVDGDRLWDVVGVQQFPHRNAHDGAVDGRQPF
jgi:hypothetical protein